LSRCIGVFDKFIGEYKGCGFLIIGAAATVRHYRSNLIKFAIENNLYVIGINNMTHIIIPDFHIWTNNQRLRDFGQCINKDSIVVFGKNLKQEIKDKWDVDYYNLNYEDRAFKGRFEQPTYNNGVSGSFRIAGNLSLYLAFLMGASEVYYAGVDGYSQPFNGNQHCYGNGFTDSGDMNYEKQKDGVILDCLRAINKVVKFKIITPTIFKEFYDESIMAANS